ncbi:MAG: cupin-like domain-containing protein [Gammaproteobacteria bacterium]|nr:cupin-like domain-containing protein [Gammaproteobacteria bacterium]
MKENNGLINKVDSLTVDEFNQNYYQKRKPVIIKNLLSLWPDLQKWNLDYLQQEIGKEKVLLQYSPNGYFKLDPKKGGNMYKSKEMLFVEYVNQLTNKKDGVGFHYLQSLSIPKQFPQLLKDIQPNSYIQGKKVMAMNFWMGSAGNVTPMHYDPMNNFLLQIKGKKRLILIKPNYFSAMYPHPWRSPIRIMSQVEFDEPDFDKFPKLANIEYSSVELHEGEMLFLPSAWWHQVYTLELAISVNMWWTPRWQDCCVPAWPLCVKTKARNVLQKNVWMACE